MDCAHCGQTASLPRRVEVSGVTAWYCDDDTKTDPTCYQIAKWSGWRDLKELRCATTRSGHAST